MNAKPSSTQPRRTLLGCFLAAAEKYPDRIAVKDRETSLTYQAMKGLILNIASALRELQVVPGNRVAVELTPSKELIAALLAVQYVGAAYVPLDKKAPLERNQLIVNDARPALIISDSDMTPHRDVKNVHIQALTSASASSDIYDQSRLENTAYIIYTSGTTGKPKGVPITHGNLEALFSATAAIYNFNQQDATLLYHSYAFDFSVWEIWSVLGYGGKLVIPDDETRIVPDALARLIKEENITLLNQTPTAFSVNADKLCQFKPDELSLRCIIFGGERLNFQTLKRWHNHFGLHSPILVNMYGITETTVHTSWHIVSDADLINPDSNIGRVLPDFHYIIRPIGNEPSAEEGGELLLSGPQVTHGYLNINNDESRKFIWLETEGVSRRYYCSGDVVKHNHDGELLYLGRCDDQVKINGFRIETGEIESVLAQIDDIDDISVLAAKTEMHGHHLICFFTTSSKIAEGDVKEKLKSLARLALPVYMRPMLYRRVDVMPKTVNGKVDKKLILHSME
ncbi:MULTISPECIES: amino acid adenylation domain-containing protein [Dickeya]|uniref:amino acid adenylation domain-containing protein n=1 Tax=Dickeya TaxID=204037 RepID=UPI000675D4DD|nr:MULTISPECIES: amino acid adenylation domain-containing protein [Dickeya]UGA50612.1 amino acid adenylation domain-containing protein [Dickeya fangzhongdai]UWH06967.1 amino acid adenylation domain-containing protein [Dickeya fangzhongdai]